MRAIPVTFTFQGEEYTGTLTKISGAADLIFSLSVNNYYWGMVIWSTQRNDFVFHGNPKNEHLWTQDVKDYFVRVIYAAGEDE